MKLPWFTKPRWQKRFVRRARTGLALGAVIAEAIATSAAVFFRGASERLVPPVDWKRSERTDAVPPSDKPAPWSADELARRRRRTKPEN